jgi:hypothetical protein
MHPVGERGCATAVADFSEKLRGNGGYTCREDCRDTHTWSGPEDLLHKCGGFNSDPRVCVGEEHADDRVATIRVMRYEAWTIPKACCQSALRKLRPNRLEGSAWKGDGRQTRKANAITFSQTLPPAPVL